MKTGRLEHVNITVSDPHKTAQWLSELFGWHVRWEGAATQNGFSMHVGGEDGYIAVYTKGDQAPAGTSSYATPGGLNHVGVVVDDIDTVERKASELGFKPHLHADYEPGRRFYFDDHDGIEWEVVSYA